MDGVIDLGEILRDAVDYTKLLGDEINWELIIGFVLFGCAVYCYDKKHRRLKVISFLLAVLFLTFGCIRLWVGVGLAIF
ncbi:MAG: hypothetical protein K6G63_05805 [Eubacterium sp.]|nr:hypothetical protein [Eubacterium sp.]